MNKNMAKLAQTISKAGNGSKEAAGTGFVNFSIFSNREVYYVRSCSNKAFDSRS